jgi:Mn2+/Fe2+ NRAMP family transporter
MDSSVQEKQIVEDPILRRPNGALAVFFKTLGPGILFASAAIGVSHLVQSTKAGALYGFDLLILIILANLFKYPFFEFGSRYASATGKSILVGYLKLGRPYLILYLILSVFSMVAVTAAVTFVTAGLLTNLLGLALSVPLVAGFVFLVCCTILGLGKFSLLDSLLKVIAVVLLISTLYAFFVTVMKGPVPRVEGFVAPEIFSKGTLIFAIALMGWMPTAVDLSSWNSIWTVERIKQTGYHPKVSESVREFNIGYFFSAGLSICFLTMGAYIMYGTGYEFPESSVVFSGQLIGLYTASIGEWAYYLIAIAAFCTMFSTSITVLDGFSRATDETISLLFYGRETSRPKRLYQIMMLIIAFFSFVIIYYLSYSLSFLVNMATILSFIIAPFIAIMNYRVIFSKDVPMEHHPKRWLKMLSIGGIIFLSVFALLFIITLII